MIALIAFLALSEVEGLVLAQDEATVPLPPSALQEPPAAKTDRLAERPIPVAGTERPEPKKLEARGDADLPSAGNFLFWTLFVLALLAGLFFVLRKVAGKTKRGGGGAIRVLARKSLAARHEVFLVEVGPKVFFVGATRENIATLGEFASPDEVAALRGQGAPDSIETSFRRTLHEGLQEAEQTPPSREVYDHLAGELGQIRSTVLSWKA